MPSPKESDEEPTPAPKKRGRPPKAKTPSDDEMDVEEVPPPKKPRAEKKGASGTASAKAKPKAKATSSPEPMEEDAEDEEEAYQDMSKYKSVETWEHLVDHIDTVERQDDGQLYVYFRLYVPISGVCWYTLTRCTGNPRKQSSLCAESHLLPARIRCRSWQVVSFISHYHQLIQVTAPRVLRTKPPLAACG